MEFLASSILSSVVSSLNKDVVVRRSRQSRFSVDLLREDAFAEKSIYKDTALHSVAHSQRKDLLLELLKTLPENRNSELSRFKNAEGNTVLHEVAASDAMIDAAEELLKRDPSLITQTNKLGEKPIFCAARHGQIGMFEFLADKMELETLTPEQMKVHLQRTDETTVLHISVRTECFNLSSLIAERYPFLINERGQSSMTALQYLACNPTPFHKGEAEIARGFIGFLMESKARITQSSSLVEKLLQFLTILHNGIFNKDLVERERQLRLLVHRLVGHNDSSNTDLFFWDTDPDQVVGSNNNRQTNMETADQEAQYLQESTLKSDESPLFLATMSNIEVIVEEILILKPEAVMHTNKDGMNILHLAVLYRHTEIFDMVIGKFEVLARRLLSANDIKGNSVLHMFGLKRKGLAREKMLSHGLQLRDELLFFEKVKAASKMVARNTLNNDNKTAEELFAATIDQLHKEAKKWIISTTQNCSLLSVFIATVAFGAAYTVPGGPNQANGYPTFGSKPFFTVFILADITSITLALISMGVFISVLASSFPLQDFQGYIYTKLVGGIICLIFSVTAMAVAYGATIVLMMARKQAHVVWVAVAFLPVPVFFLSYLPLVSVFLDRHIKRIQTFFIQCCYLSLLIIMRLFLTPLFLPDEIFKGRRRVGGSMRKSGNQSQPTSGTQSPHPTSDTALHHV